MKRTSSPSPRTLVLSALAALAALLGAGPLLATWIIRHQVVPKVEARLGRHVGIGEAWVRWGVAELRDVVVDGDGAPAPVKVPRVRVRFAMRPLLLGRVVVEDLLVDQPRVSLARGGLPGEDNVTTMLERLRVKRAGTGGAGGAGGDGRLTIGRVRVVGGALAVADERLGEAQVAAIDADLPFDGEGEVRLRGAQAKLAGAQARAETVTLKVLLEKGRPKGAPQVEVADGALVPLRGLELTGVHGTVQPDADPERVRLDVRGSYGGAKAELWNATGWINTAQREGELKVRAARFKLKQLDAVLKNELMNAKSAEAGARFDVKWKGDRVTYAGNFHLSGLTVAHRMVAPVAVPNLGFDARTKGSVDLAAKHLKLDELSVDYRRVHATLTADIENLGAKPKLRAALQVKPLPCQVALGALPAEVTPNLQGFQLAGNFSTDLHVAIDFADLEQPIDLGGKVGIEGCRVVSAPAWPAADRLQTTFEQTVQIEPGRWMTFFAGPENPDFTPYEEISPHLVNSIMTTEDNGFFKHRGFIAAEFRTALQQNLQRGYFRLGASSITMQMVKNVLLSREKTLSRKLQEMFLTWYLEHHLTKERILEIYFNVIEFGPGIYGIGRATRHYFGKPPRDLEPQEAAFFSSILPSPKRRYVQYCRKEGTVDAKWDAYLKRIMRRNHERGRLTDEEYERAVHTPLRFDRTHAMPERECLAMVKRVTTPPGSPPQQTASRSPLPR